MRDGSGDPRNSSANIVPLAEFLDGTHPAFRTSVLDALAREGFEVDETLPNLQLAADILEAIDWLESRGHGQHWTRFEAALRAADQKGILVNLGAPGRVTAR